MQPNLTATIWLSPYRICYQSSDGEFTGRINRPDEYLLLKTLSKVFAFLAEEGYTPLILHTEH
jgi:hypothetical protein